jgi:hypothetical protein
MISTVLKKAGAEQHVQNEEHKRNSNALKNNSQFSFSVPTTTSSTSSMCSKFTTFIQLLDPNKSLSFDEQV